jgi:hypothetical protein
MLINWGEQLHRPFRLASLHTLDHCDLISRDREADAGMFPWTIPTSVMENSCRRAQDAPLSGPSKRTELVRCSSRFAAMPFMLSNGLPLRVPVTALPAFLPEAASTILQGQIENSLKG